MPKVLGIVAEYNPLHNGHLYQLVEAKRQSQADCVIVVMSGNFMQRGEPAWLDKWQRTELALSAGIDLVVELPAKFAVQPAHLFAKGAIQILATLGCDVVAFGAEHPDLDFDQLVANQPIQESAHFKQFNETYPTLFHDYLLATTGINLEASNDILAFAYAAANQQLKRPMALLPIQRRGSDHRDSEVSANHSVASGSAIRKLLVNRDFDQIAAVVPETTLSTLKAAPAVTWTTYWPFLRYQLLSASLAQLETVYQMTEGIEYRLQRAAQQATDFANFLQLAKTKRYTYSRLQRLATNVLWQVHTDELPGILDYVRILGFNGAGQQLLNRLKKTAPLPLITKVTPEWVAGPYWLDYRVGRLRQMVTGVDQDLTRHPIVKP
ncbi:nucleotidyltransferase [Secundilactobacillus kimchicus]|uniref:nucleotidyltransferase n=1 Tax=Secundilactobacillus kimchicus TaxID=528209 RepID=UPI0024A7FE00|nr:nucleotidyltransferase [Secundilactobacillus kimchicus]